MPAGMGFKDLVLLVKGLNPVAIWMNAPDSLREFVRYSAFVIFYSLTLFVNRPNEETFWLNERLKYLIFHRKIPFDVFPFMMMLPDLVEIEEFWMWMDNVFFSMMYDETVVGAMPNATAIFGVSFLCGGIRIRQVRVEEEECKWHPPGLNITRCFPAWSAGTEDKQPFGPINETTGLGVWEWGEGPTSFPYEYFGQIGQYPASGYWLDLPTDRDEAWRMYSELQPNDWVDSATRAIMIDVPLYNANMGMFIALTFIFETPQGTGVIARVQQRTLRLYRYETGSDLFMMVVEILFCLLLAYYVAMELKTILKEGPFVYFVKLWNLLDWINYGVLAVVFVLRFLWMQEISRNPPSMTEYKSIHFAAFLAKQELNINAANSFITYFKLFKYVGAIPRMDQLFRTLGLAQSDLIHFAIMFGIVFSGFMAAFYMAFSLEVPEFRTIPKTIFTLLCFLLGDFNFYAMLNANRVLAPVLFIGYIMFALYCLLNMFLAILNDAYSEIKQQDAQKATPNFAAFKSVSGMVGMLKKVSNLEAFKNENLEVAADIESSMKTADADMDGQVTVTELYKVLLKHRATLANVNMIDGDDMDDGKMDDDEVMDQAKVMFEKLDVDQKGFLDEEEMKQVRAFLQEGAEEAGQLMAMCDTDNDGDVEGHELALMSKYKEMDDQALDELTDAYEAQVKQDANPMPSARIELRYRIQDHDMQELDMLISKAMKHMNRVTKHAMSSKAERLAAAYFKTLNQKIDGINTLMPEPDNFALHY